MLTWMPKLQYQRLFVLATLAFGLLGPQALQAANDTRGVQFKDPLNLPSAIAGEHYSLDLIKNELADPGTPPYTLWAIEGAPSWLNVSNGILSGDVPENAVGTLSFKLSVKDQDAEHGDLHHPATLVVLPAAPKFTDSNINLGVTQEGANLDVDLHQFLTIPSSAVSFTASGLKPWMRFDNISGRITGSPDWSPQHKYVGPYSGITFTATNSGGTGNVTAHGLVTKKLICPKWTVNPITDLPDANELVAYNADVSGKVLNPEGMALEYDIVSATPPPWVNVGKTTGTLFGTPPQPANVELVVSLTPSDASCPADSTTVKFKVNHVHKAPRWLANPIVLQETTNGVLVTQPLIKSVLADPEAKLNFTITGPDWAKIDPQTGVFSGKAGKTNIGVNSFQAVVNDPGFGSDTTELRITIKKAIEPPYWVNHPTVDVPQAAEDKNYTNVDFSHTKYTVHPDGLQKHFTKIDGPQWLTVHADGTTAGTPGASDVGLNKFHVRVSDNISTPNDVTEVQIMVAHTNHAPYWTLNPIIVFTVPEEQPLNLSVAPYAKDPDNDALIFNMISGPSWAQLDKDGNFIGTPQIANEGENHFMVVVADPSNATAQVEVVIKVQHVNHPPVWTSNPVVLLNAKEDTDYTANLSGFATDPDLPNDHLRFAKISRLPTWLTVRADGTVAGKPSHSDAGKIYSFQASVMDDANAQAVATVQITVDKIPHPPQWLADPILMNDAYEDTSYTFKLSDFATDPDGGTLSFEKVEGPNWMIVSKDGNLTGVPSKADLGQNILATFKVTNNSNLSATTHGKINVIHKNHPPVVSSIPTLTVKERETAEFNLTDYVKDPDEDKINFVLLATAGCDGWLNLSNDGQLILTPKRKDLGAHDCNFKADDGQLMSPGVLHIQVEKNPRAPIWLTEPIATLEGKTNQLFSISVANLAKDLDGEQISFSKQAGKDWLKVNADGSVSGTPGDADLGSNEFTLRVTNQDSLFSDGTLIITVVPGTQKDHFQVDKSGPAPSELLWIIDNSKACDSTIKALKKNINLFYNDLDAAQITHADVILSSDVDKFKALPIHADGESSVFGAGNVVTDFNKRVDEAESFGMCNNCRNSPIWAMFRFFEQLPTPKLSDIYHKTYTKAGVPTDAILITHQLDHYKYYTSKLPDPLKSYTPNDFARDFVAFNRQEKKAYRVSAIAPGCPDLISSEPSSAAPSNAYNVIVEKTNGTYYVNQCHFDMEATLHDYAKDVIFRARVNGNNPFALSQKPKDVKSLKVSIAGTGLAEDQWSYDAGSNSIKINWYLIDTNKLKPGDQIEVEYRISWKSESETSRKS